MEIDVEKIMPEITDNHLETIILLVNANHEIIEALLIIQSTIETWDNAECLLINKQRMITFFDKYKKGN